MISQILNSSGSRVIQTAPPGPTRFTEGSGSPEATLSIPCLLRARYTKSSPETTLHSFSDSFFFFLGKKLHTLPLLWSPQWTSLKPVYSWSHFFHDSWQHEWKQKIIPTKCHDNIAPSVWCNSIIYNAMYTTGKFHFIFHRIKEWKISTPVEGEEISCKEYLWNREKFPIILDKYAEVMSWMLLNKIHLGTPCKGKKKNNIIILYF